MTFLEANEVVRLQVLVVVKNALTSSNPEATKEDNRRRALNDRIIMIISAMIHQSTKGNTVANTSYQSFSPLSNLLLSFHK
jgi:hypothetical protein